MFISSLAIILSVSAACAFVAKSIKQPLLVGYVVAGIILSLTGLVDKTATSEFGHIGVALLLFTVGLSLSFKEVRELGGVVFAAGIGQIAITVAVGLALLTVLLGYSVVPALYIAIGLTFSSTIILVKILGEKNDLGSLYGKISVGFLLVQDFAAIALIVFLTSLGSGDGVSYLILLTKAVLLVVGVIILSRYVFPKIIEKYASDNPEFLFIVSLAWALGFANFVAGPVGLSLEIGGLLAGLALSGLPQEVQITSMIKPIRELFLTLFFVSLGAHLHLESILGVLPQAAVLSLLVIVGNPIIMLVILGFLGYGRRTALFVGLATAQVSEFSFILLEMGLARGHITETQQSLVVLVALITMSSSTYLLMEAEKIYDKLRKVLLIFERKKTREHLMSKTDGFSDHFIVAGCGKTGMKLIKYLLHKKVQVVVVDFDPGIIDSIRALDVDFIFGDITDQEVMTLIKPESARMIISTIPTKAENIAIVEQIRKARKLDVPLMVTSPDVTNAELLKSLGADIVTVPALVTGTYMTFLMRSYFKNPKKFNELKLKTI